MLPAGLAMETLAMPRLPSLSDARRALAGMTLAVPPRLGTVAAAATHVTPPSTSALAGVVEEPATGVTVALTETFGYRGRHQVECTRRDRAEDRIELLPLREDPHEPPIHRLKRRRRQPRGQHIGDRPYGLTRWWLAPRDRDENSVDRLAQLDRASVCVGRRQLVAAYKGAQPAFGIGVDDSVRHRRR